MKTSTHTHILQLHELLYVLLGNTLIASVLWLAGIRGQFVEIWLVSQCIGFGINLTHAGLCLLNKNCNPYGWMLALGIVLGATLGMVTAFILGIFPEMLPEIDWSSLGRIAGLALIFGVVVSIFFHNIGRINAMKLAQQAAELREMAQQKEAATAHLKLLQAQIEPHFLFNTLANLHSLIGQNDALARTLLERLNDYLRASLDHSRAASGTLADECRLLAAYLDIQALRMGGRLCWNIAVSDDLQALPFPPMLLQPLIENAIRHGIEPRIGPGNVTLSAQFFEGRLRLSVVDDGIGLTANTTASGVGLANIKERLAAIYGSGAELTLRDNPPTGVIAELWIPLAAPAP